MGDENYESLDVNGAAPPPPPVRGTEEGDNIYESMGIGGGADHPVVPPPPPPPPPPKRLTPSEKRKVEPIRDDDGADLDSNKDTLKKMKARKALVFKKPPSSSESSMRVESDAYESSPHSEEDCEEEFVSENKPLTKRKPPAKGKDKKNKKKEPIGLACKLFIVIFSLFILVLLGVGCYLVYARLSSAAPSKSPDMVGKASYSLIGSAENPVLAPKPNLTQIQPIAVRIRPNNRTTIPPRNQTTTSVVTNSTTSSVEDTTTVITTKKPAVPTTTSVPTTSEPTTTESTTRSTTTTTEPTTTSTIEPLTSTPAPTEPSTTTAAAAATTTVQQQPEVDDKGDVAVDPAAAAAEDNGHLKPMQPGKAQIPSVPVKETR